MKLIIEIPIDLLERTKSGDYNFGDDLARNEVIANGIPYTPIGDAISREALKNNEPHYDEEGYRVFYESEIDNAQAIPQGEWARHDEWRGGEYIGGFYHVNCPCEDGYYSKWETNFCPNCGLPMKKGGAE